MFRKILLILNPNYRFIIWHKINLYISKLIFMLNKKKSLKKIDFLKIVDNN